MDDINSLGHTLDVLTAFFLGAFCMLIFVVAAYGKK